ncbi:16S rRNA (cytidine(1402)-2'-O)-methyltransferase [Proteiniborus sp. MB09-C3]|uniref:16S rRNA (cytidine(1402)-2'-O)-methyltransferase n=1 Tax=Proteiniborus sp. MB09-C3 TaxID=3050072 RepID=UPI002555232C|nr:16S rRNA (cytidine(1402)-2'-O)-methyltransferase [Proteiniborus sp. MB09-C3]WIV12312.1 16S rRNA (cytidine(1402)-2'-O)-methyltransferase [Proteiniborus sp. MB09-C3]
MDVQGKLYICPTPIGNLEDITLRVLKVLKEVDLIAAEDTRHTIKLLNHFDIKKPLTSYHEHNKREKGKLLIQKLLNGENIALVSDAGMPGISDPGEDLIKLAIESDLEVIALPGPTASTLALVISGLPTRKFVFEGFLPSNKKERREALLSIKSEERTIILYESPYRVKALLDDMLSIFGERDIALCRELTKKYEEIFRGSIKESINRFTQDDPKGEFVIIVKGAEKTKVNSISEEWAGMTIKDHLLKYTDEGMTKKDAVKRVAEDRGLPKNEVYKESIDI